MKKLLQFVILRYAPLALCLCVSVAAPVFAQDVRCTPERGGAECAFAPRVRAALEKLDLGCKGWSIVPLDELEWARTVGLLAIAQRKVDSKYAFTLRTARRTYLRESTLAGQPEKLLLEVLAHEFAHLRICAANENCAKETAARIVRLLATEEKP